jgi:hypothetical protein
MRKPLREVVNHATQLELIVRNRLGLRPQQVQFGSSIVVQRLPQIPRVQTRAAREGAHDALIFEKARGRVDHVARVGGGEDFAADDNLHSRAHLGMRDEYWLARTVDSL